MNIRYYLLLLAITFTQYSYAAPELTLCIDGDCKNRQRITLSNNDWNNINDIFSEPAKTTQQERKLIAKALSQIKKTALKMLAYRAVKDFSAEDLHYKMNYRDRALNCKSYIALLLDNRLIHQHAIRKIEQRSSWVGMNEYAVVILDKVNGELYSVDSSKAGFSESPSIKPFREWKSNKTLKGLANKTINIIIEPTQFINYAD